MPNPAESRPPLSYGWPLPDDLRARLVALADEHGEAAVRRQLDIAPQTLARCLGGLRVQRGTAELVRNKIDEVEAALQRPTAPPAPPPERP